MTSQFFYLPATQKVDEEKRIKFTQERIKIVKDWMQEKIVNKFTENDFDCRSYLSDFGEHRRVVNTKIVTEKDCNITLYSRYGDNLVRSGSEPARGHGEGSCLHATTSR